VAAGSPSERVVICGGGVGGLAAAIAIHAAGWDVEVFERSDDPVREAGTAFNLWGNAVTALDRIGLGAAVRDLGDPIERMRLLDHRGRMIAENPIGEIGRSIGTTSVNIRRSDLCRLLVEACQSRDIPVHMGRRCSGFRGESGGATALFTDGAEEKGAVLIGADGARSAVRAHLLNDGEPLASSFPVRGISDDRGDVPANTVLMSWGPRGGGVGCWPLSDGTVSWTVGTNSRLKRRIDKGDDPRQAVLDFLGAFPDMFTRLVRATPTERIVTSPVLVREQAQVWGAGPATLIGDAAHAMPTVFSQGACQALEDAVVLGEEFAKNSGNPVDALRAYEQRRKPRMDWLRKRVFTLDKMQKFENRLLCAVRDIATRKAPAEKSTKSWEQMMTFGLTPAE
jgi:FAD-dependent urate hydroxylase